MRHLGFVFALAITATSSLAQPVDPAEGCARARDLAQRVKSCSDLLRVTTATDEQKALAYRNRGLARAEAGALDDAINDLTNAIKFAPGDAAALAGRAHARLSKGQADSAIVDFTAAIKLSPQRPSLVIGRGHAQLVKGDADAAIADFSEAIRLQPGSAVAYNNRGLAWRKKGDNDKAIVDFTKAIELNPIYALAYNNRGYAHEAKNMRVEAVADFGRAFQLDGSLVGATAGLRRLKASGEPLKESDRLVAEGKAIVEKSCSRCHAVGMNGLSPNQKAPEFRTLQLRHPVQALREPLTRAIAAPHDEMPKFTLPDADIDKIAAYINSLPSTATNGARRK